MYAADFNYYRAGSVAEAGDLLKKHRRPVTTKEMFAQSLKGGRGKRKAA